jgi:hypothetical protein
MTLRQNIRFRYRSKLPRALQSGSHRKFPKGGRRRRIWGAYASSRVSFGVSPNRVFRRDAPGSRQRAAGRGRVRSRDLPETVVSHGANPKILAMRPGKKLRGEAASIHAAWGMGPIWTL